MKVAVYLRLSEEKERSASVALQRKVCLGKADALYPDAGVDVYEDVDISGYKEVARPDFERLLANVSAYDALIVYRIDRLTRRGSRHLLELVEDLLNPASCALVSATEPIDTSGPFGELFLVLLASLARMESQRLGERQTASQAYRREAGRWTAGVAPFGYRKVSADDGTGVFLEQDPAAAPIIRSVARALTEGRPLSAAVAGLGGPTTVVGWKTLLSNPTLAGYRAHKGQIIFGEDGQPLQPYEPILDPALWRQIQPLLNQRGPRRASRTSLLGGLAVCGRCGLPLTGGRRPTYSSYQCTRREGCQSNAIHMENTDSIVLGTVAAWLPELVARGRRAQQAPADDKQAEHLEAVRAYLDEQMDRLLFEEHRTPTDPAVRRLQERIDTARVEADALRERGPRSLPAALHAVANGTDIRSLPLDSQRRIVETAAGVQIRPVASGSRRGVFDPARVEVSRLSVD